MLFHELRACYWIKWITRFLLPKGSLSKKHAKSRFTVVAVRYAKVSLPTTSLCLKSSTSLQLAYVFVPKNVLLTFHSCPYESTILEISYQIAATVNCNCNAILLVGTKVLNHGCFIAVLSYFSTHILRHSSHEILLGFRINGCTPECQ